MKQLIYQLLPRLWGNGRFSGIDAESLRYFKSLGMDYLWYTGIIRHASASTGEKVVKGEAGSPYAITDYYDVNPYLADHPAQRMEEFGQLLERTHRAGLKVLIDFVPNHVAREYKGELGQQDDRSVHWKAENDFYYYPGEKLALPLPCKGYSEFPARASGNCFSSAPALTDWYETVKINYCDFHTPTWDKMLDIVLFWAGKGVDGFSCDMVELVPPQFMQWLIAKVKEKFPEQLFVAEVYEKDKYRMYLEDVGFDMLYDKSGLYDTLRAITCSNASAKGISWNWQFLGPLQARMLNFLENHDEQRLASGFFCGSAQKAYAALAVSLLLNQAPFMLYFGQEIGERGMDNEPFSGLNGRTTIFDWWTVQSLQRLHKEILEGKGVRKEEKAILKRYKELLALSKTPAFSEGKTYDLCYCQDADNFHADRHFAFLRNGGGKCFLVVANFSGESEISVRIPADALTYLGIKAVRTVYTLTVSAFDYAIIEVQ